jgi:hypothetical protein
MNWFTKWLAKENDVEKPSEPVVEDVKVPLISEPVLSLIESLKNREWSFIYEEAVMSTVFKCGHIGNKLQFTAVKIDEYELFPSSHIPKYRYYCRDSWMTKEEGELVSITAFQVMTEENEEWRIANNWKEREKFMILTKEKK